MAITTPAGTRCAPGCCILRQTAAEGGDNELLDHEIAYIRIRDQNPEWIRALMAADAFTIPSNTEGGEQIRPDHGGPVFSVSPADGRCTCAIRHGSVT